MLSGGLIIVDLVGEIEDWMFCEVDLILFVGLVFVGMDFEFEFVDINFKN